MCQARSGNIAFLDHPWAIPSCAGSSLGRSPEKHNLNLSNILQVRYIWLYMFFASLSIFVGNYIFGDTDRHHTYSKIQACRLCQKLQENLGFWKLRIKRHATIGYANQIIWCVYIYNYIYIEGIQPQWVNMNPYWWAGDHCKNMGHLDGEKPTRLVSSVAAKTPRSSWSSKIWPQILQRLGHLLIHYHIQSNIGTHTYIYIISLDLLWPVWPVIRMGV